MKLQSISKWQAPKGGGAPLLTMPNVPLPLHKLAPRTIMASEEWKTRQAALTREERMTWAKMRQFCYEGAGDVCEICGQKLSGKKGDVNPLHHAHELYNYDYETRVATFERCVCLCPVCHAFIHSGRALTCYCKCEPLWDKTYMLSLAEHGFKQIQKWNHLHPNDEPLRVYETFQDWLDEPALHDDLEQLMKQYEIQMYGAANRITWENDWTGWKLIFEGKEYQGLYTSREDWKRKMETHSSHNDKDLFSDESINVMAELQDGFWIA